MIFNISPSTIILIVICLNRIIFRLSMISRVGTGCRRALMSKWMRLDFCFPRNDEIRPICRAASLTFAWHRWRKSLSMVSSGEKRCSNRSVLACESCRRRVQRAERCHLHDSTPMNFAMSFTETISQWILCMTYRQSIVVSDRCW